MELKTNYVDDQLDTTKNTKREYEIITNANGTKSLNDVTEYTVVGDKFGAEDINATNTEVNSINTRLGITRATLTAGETSITISDERITTDSVLSFYTDIYGVNPTAVSVKTGSVTLTFKAQTKAIEVGVRVDG